MIQLRRLRDDKEKEGDAMRTAGLLGIEKGLKPIFDEIQAKENYDMILNYVPGVVIMASQRVNITEQVRTMLNARLKAGN